jgi:PAS domain S-box-containing protein
MVSAANKHNAVCLTLTRAISESRTVDDIYAIALDALSSELGVDRAAILLFDPDGVMRFKAHRGLSDTYRAAVEGHSPWAPNCSDAQSIAVPDISTDETLKPYRAVIDAEGIAAMAFIPLVSLRRVIGKFMLYYREPRVLSDEEMELTCLIAAQVAFAVERTRAAAQAQRSEERLRFALDAALMGTWDWDLITNTVRWSENLECIHGMREGSFEGTFASYERGIHPEDRARVLASARRAITHGVPHDVEYRTIAADGSIRWCEGKGRVEYENGRAVRMTGVCMMVTRRKEAELARLAAAEEASRMKDEFLATLSHELRTPLNAIVGWVQLLQTSGLQPERVRQAIDVIGRNARLQVQLIEDILDVSRIITGKLQLDWAPVSIRQLIDNVVAGASPAAAEKQIHLQTSVCDDVPPVEGDPRRLHQVLSNVLSNAIKFTPEHGQIDVECAVNHDWLEITVRDSGIGIAAEFLPHVFERFRQADSRATRRHGGLGLGLAIARHVVREHAGDITAHSDGEGLGTTVSIRLPAAPPPALRDTPLALLYPGAGVRLDGAVVLVVDDQRDSREVLAMLLEQRGANVIHADSADAALQALRQSPASLMIADIGMPQVDGYELIRRVRALGNAMPAIAVTAYARPADRDRAMAAGFTAYCPKPIDGPQLLATVHEIVSLS